MSNLKTVLNELYSLDPSLREREAELVPLLQKLLDTKPDAEIDEAFVSRLRARLETEPVRRFAWFHPWMFVVPAFVLALAAMLPTMLPGSSTSSDDNDGGVSISLLADSAFGALMGSGGSDNAALGTREAMSSISPLTADSKMAYGMGGSASETSVIVGEPYPSTIYQYLFDGELTLPGAEGTVYRKTMGINIPSSIAGALASDLGPVDFSGLSGLEPQYITLRNSEYSISVDPMYGTVYINDNDGYRTDGSPMTASDLPDEATLVSTAKAILDKFGVDMNGYGDPTIDNSTIRAMAGLQTDYISEYATVNWPLKVDGVSVYNSDGSGYGISVTVNMKTKDAVSVSINAISSAEASSYTLETDTSKILEVVQKGGVYSWQPEGASSTIDITLGAPSVVLMPHSTWNESTQRSDELFVPALMFPVTDNAGETLYRSAVVVPLVQSILESASEEPMYRILDTGTGAAEDSATSE